MRIPLVYSPKEIKEWHVDEEYAVGKWRLSRPCGFNYWSLEWIKYRCRILYGVLIGKYDILNWGNPEEKTGNYRDILDMKREKK